MFVLVRHPPAVLYPIGRFFNFNTGIGQPQTLWETTWTLQYKPAPSLMTRFEYRYDHSNKAVFLDNDTPKTNQQTLGILSSLPVLS